MRHLFKAFAGGARQRLLMIGVGDLDQGLGALTQILGIEIGNAPLSYDVMYMGAGGDNASAWPQQRRNA
jgi:hypothetical protein